MYVCEDCHNKDKEAIGCKIPINSHPKHYFGFTHQECEICGKTFPSLYVCVKYDERIKK